MISDWKEVSLKEICKTQYGYTASATDVNTGVKFLRITDIVPGFIDWNNVPYCQISEKDYLKYKVNENDIVVARTGATVGYAKQIRKGSPNSVFASYLVKLIPSDKADEKFLGILVESNIYKEFIQTIAGGSAQPNANANDLTLFKFKIPPLPVQQRIASILSAYDDLIEVNNQRIKLLEETARELYKEWFVRMRFPGYKQAKFKKGVPEGWGVKALYDIADITYGFPFQSELFNDKGIGTSIIRIRDLVDGVSNTFTPEIADEKYLTQDGDILVGMDGDFHFCKWAGVTSWINQRNVRFRPKANSLISSYFLYHVTKPQVEFLNEIIVGTTVAHLSATDLKKMKLLIPTNHLLEQFKKITDPIYEQEIILKKENTQLRQIRDRLLPRLVSGKLKVSGSEFSELKNEQNQFKKNEQN